MELQGVRCVCETSNKRGGWALFMSEYARTYHSLFLEWRGYSGGKALDTRHIE